MLELKNINKVFNIGTVDETVLFNDFNFTVEDGEFVSVIGSNGSGKTTLLNILASLDRPTAGEVLLNGKNLSEVPEKQLAAFRRNHLGFVFQDFNLLDTFSIQDNIFLPLVLAKTPVVEMRKRIIPIARMLGIEDILNKYPYEISGGQKQRISIARVFLKNPPILILDEATSALDNESERWIQQSLEELAKNRTTITIAHRLSTIRNADEILVVADNRICERGTHDELIAENGIYAHYYEMQFE